MRVVDLSNKKRNALKVVLPDKTEIDVFTPTKAVRDCFSILGEALIRIGNKNATSDDIDTVFAVTAQILSRNKQGVIFSTESVAAIMDIEDATTILDAYTEFLSEEIGDSAKN